MSRPVRVTLMGKAFTLQTDEPEAHVHEVARLVDDRLRELGQRARLPEISLALLAALTLADDLEKERAVHAELRRELRERSARLRDRLRELGDEP